MRLPKRGEKGFTLIELLIVVAILGVLAAVVIPNVGRFIGRGETEAENTEFANIQVAVNAMMLDNNLSELETGDYSATPTSDMSLFPDPTPTGDKFILYGCNVTGVDYLVNYVATQNTTGTYTCGPDGTVSRP